MNDKERSTSLAQEIDKGFIAKCAEYDITVESHPHIIEGLMARALEECKKGEA